MWRASSARTTANDPSRINQRDGYRERPGHTTLGTLPVAIPKLKDIQNFYQTHGGIFVYVFTPSKAAHLPEYFVNRLPCPSTQAARTQLLPDYVGALRRAGINVVDTASLIHSLKDTYPFDLFPQGGVHWNDVGGAVAVSAVVDEINRLAGHEIIPPFKFTYAMSKPAKGADGELADLLNVFFPPLGYQTPKVSFQPSMPCAESPALRSVRSAWATATRSSSMKA